MRYYVALSVLFILGACASAPPAGPKLPIPVPYGSQPLFVEEPHFRLAAGKRIGTDHSIVEIPIQFGSDLKVDSYEIQKTISPDMKELGYHVVDGVNKGDGQARYRVQGTVTHLSYDVWGKLNGNYSDMSMDVEWKLYAPGEKVVYISSSFGSYRDQGRPPGRNMFAKTFREAFRQLLADERFVSYLAFKDDLGPSPFLTNSEFIDGAPCDVTTPADALNSVVRIQVGSLVGSGFVISPDGYILADGSLLSGIYTIPVYLPGRREVRAKILRIDRKMNVALLKIPGVEKTACLPTAATPIDYAAPFTVAGIQANYTEVSAVKFVGHLIQKSPYAELVETRPQSFAGSALMVPEKGSVAVLAQLKPQRPDKLTALPIGDTLSRLFFRFVY